jgi:5-deoxy-D-glucuronate isomerase
VCVGPSPDFSLTGELRAASACMSPSTTGRATRSETGQVQARPVDAPVIVRDGSIERIATGWHPVVAPPDCEMYYLRALAGDTVASIFHDDDVRAPQPSARGARRPPA